METSRIKPTVYFVEENFKELNSRKPVLSGKYVTLKLQELNPVAFTSRTFFDIFFYCKIKLIIAAQPRDVPRDTVCPAMREECFSDDEEIRETLHLIFFSQLCLYKCDCYNPRMHQFKNTVMSGPYSENI